MPAGSGDAWADDYERGRPGWPSEILDVAGLPPSATVLDLAAGTGKLTRLLLSAFERVVAVEPAAAMRRILRQSCPAPRTLDGAAEEIPIPEASVDAVFVAQAFHAFEADRAVAEIARVLRPGGAVVLAWNVPAGPWKPSTAAAEALLTERGPDEVPYIPLDLGGPRSPPAEAFRPPRFEPIERARLANAQMLDREGLVSFYASMGWLADLPDDDRLPLIQEVRSLLPAAVYERRWETEVYWTRRASRSRRDAAS